MLKFNKIYKQYDTPILGPINLEIEKDSFVSILGSSGAGKSTLLRLASNLIQPTSGSIEYLNNNKPDYQRDLSLESYKSNYDIETESNIFKKDYKNCGNTASVFLKSRARHLNRRDIKIS